MLTLTQLYNLGLSQNVDIFDCLVLPSGSPINRDIMINTILVHCGLNVPMYADPFVMRSAVNIWSAKNQYTFEHLAKIYTADYSPIENTDRYDEITVKHDRTLNDDTGSASVKKEDLDTSSFTNNSSTQSHKGTDTNVTEETTSAFNSSDYKPDTKTKSDTTYDSSIIDIGSTNTRGSSDKKTDVSSSITKAVDEAENTKTIQHLHGNIGVSTNTQLQTEEYQLLKDYNPYTFIAGLFENELTLCVY